MLEQARQKKITNRLQQEGWLVVKLIKTNTNGIPDLMALKNGRTMFIEVKQPKGVLSEIQKLRIGQLRLNGFTVHIWTDYEKSFIDDNYLNIESDEMRL
jgi:Holliday junction resolvase